MKCLYCGKGIGPIRLLRDLEFCSQAHRDEFRERYRQRLYEALAPEPAPASLADFRERTPAARGPAPTLQLRVLPRSLPGQFLPPVPTDAVGGEAVLASLAELIELNNQYYPDFELSISTGIATSRPGDRLEQVVKRADLKMLHAKRLYYLAANRDRRGTGAA